MERIKSRREKVATCKAKGKSLEKTIEKSGQYRWFLIRRDFRFKLFFLSDRVRWIRVVISQNQEAENCTTTYKQKQKMLHKILQRKQRLSTIEKNPAPRKVHWSWNQNQTPLKRPQNTLNQPNDDQLNKGTKPHLQTITKQSKLASLNDEKTLPKKQKSA